MSAWERTLRQLLPYGKLFDEIKPTSDLAKLNKALSLEFERVDARARDFVAEFDPRTAVESLSDWERSHGLPDVRVPVLPSTTAGRRAAIVLKLVMRGAQNEAAYRALIEACGWELIEVRKLWRARRMFRAGDRAMNRVYGLRWAMTVEFVVGNEIVDALPLADLTRVLQHTMQAHAFALVTYSP